MRLLQRPGLSITKKRENHCFSIKKFLLLSYSSIGILQDLKQQMTMEGEGAAPFFLAVGMHSPHIPYHVEERFARFYPLDRVAACPNPSFPENYPRGINYSVSANYFLSQDFVASQNDEGRVSKDFSRQARRGYFAEITAVDFRIGRIPEELDRLGRETWIDTADGVFSPQYNNNNTQFPFFQSCQIPQLLCSGQTTASM